METVQKTCSRQCRQRESALGIFVKLLSKPLFCTFSRGETIVTIGCASDLPSFDNVHRQFQRGPAAEEHPEIQDTEDTIMEHHFRMHTIHQMKEHLMALLLCSTPFYSAPLNFTHFRKECFIFLLQILPLQGWKVVMVSWSRETTKGNRRMWEPFLSVLMMTFPSVDDICPTEHA